MRVLSHKTTQRPYIAVEICCENIIGYNNIYWRVDLMLDTRLIQNREKFSVVQSQVYFVKHD